MKKIILILAVILCLSSVLTSCGGKSDNGAKSTNAQNEQTEAKSEQTETEKAGASYSITMLMGSTFGTEKYKYSFIVKNADLDVITDTSLVKAEAEIKNKNGEVVFSGAPTIVANGATGLSAEVYMADVKKGSTNIGTVNIKITVGDATETATDEITKLPYDFADVTLPEVKNGYINKSSSGAMRVTYDVTAVSIDESSVTYTNDGITFKIKFEGKITARGEMYKSANTPSIELVGYSADGKTELFTKNVSTVAGDNDTFTGTVIIMNYLPGTNAKIEIKQ